MLKFDPCGHTLSLESFVAGVDAAFGGGSARHEIKASPGLGTYCLTCPVREAALPCTSSFVHDVHHYKLCGRSAYDRIKTFGLEASGIGGGGGGWGAAAGVPAPVLAPMTTVDGLVATITDIITHAQVVRCPYEGCGTVFEKDGACTHIDTCPGRLPDGSKHGRICYYCGKRWCDVDPPSSKSHRDDWRTNPARCIWFLVSYIPRLARPTCCLYTKNTIAKVSCKCARVSVTVSCVLCARRARTHCSAAVTVSRLCKTFTSGDASECFMSVSTRRSPTISGVESLRSVRTCSRISTGTTRTREA
jgi:hypothetical protein